jgi:hypothetical protein
MEILRLNGKCTQSHGVQGNAVTNPARQNKVYRTVEYINNGCVCLLICPVQNPSLYFQSHG